MCDREGCWLGDDECTADYHEAQRYAMGPEEPEPCQYCSVMTGVLRECDLSCEALTRERWIELTANG